MAADCPAPTGTSPFTNWKRRHPRAGPEEPTAPRDPRSSRDDAILSFEQLALAPHATLPLALKNRAYPPQTQRTARERTSCTTSKAIRDHPHRRSTPPWPAGGAGGLARSLPLDATPRPQDPCRRDRAGDQNAASKTRAKAKASGDEAEFERLLARWLAKEGRDCAPERERQKRSTRADDMAYWPAEPAATPRMCRTGDEDETSSQALGPRRRPLDWSRR